MRWWLLVAAAVTGAPASRVTARTTLEVIAPVRDVLAVAWAGPRRLVLLRPESVVLARLDAGRAVVESEQPLPGPRVAVRSPGGLIGGPAAGPVWVMTSRAPRAALFEIDRSGLRLRSEADAVPWPGVAEGLRFRASTNLIDGTFAGRPGPFAAAEAMSGAAVSADGTLVMPGAAESDFRVGTALVAPWPGWLVASSARPPGEDDRLTVLQQEGDTMRPVDELKLAGTVAALAVRLEGERAILAVAMASGAESRLAVLELTRGPGPP